MRRPLVGLVGLALACTGSLYGGTPAAASPVQAVTGGPGSVSNGKVHDLPNPLEDKRRALRQQALTGVISGDATAVTKNGSTVVDLGPGATATAADAGARSRSASNNRNRTHNYVELARQKTDKIFVILAEFGNERDPLYPDQDTDPDTPGPTVFDGPLHNAIPAPDAKDNSTVWQPDYNRGYYQQLYFGTGAGVESVKTYYERQSSGRYSVDGTVSDWVKVRYNEARYGRSGGFPCAGIVCSNTWDLVRDAANQWVADQQAAGRTDAQIKADLAAYDQWDRYDVDGDGNFDEPDGYIDHFQIVHAGGDEADGDPFQGEDAVWSHRWYAFQGGIGSEGPAGAPLGGTQVGDTGVWIGDYTIQPENGGLSVFVHEYGHDLGLPDHYDTAGGPDNGVDWWTLMAQSRAWAPGDQGIGTRAADLSAWDKLQLGWFDYDVVAAGTKKTLNLGPHEYNTKDPQGVVVTLPDKSVTRDLVPPKTGAASWWSGAGDDLDNTLTRSVTLPSGPATLSFAANWDIEDCGPDPCDYAYVEVDDGTGFKAVAGSITNPAENNGVDGTSDGWVDATFDLSAYAGKTVGLRLRYSTDGAAGGLGFFADDITLTSGTTTVFTDGAESGANGWTADGFSAVGATTTQEFAHFYIASYRAYTSYDTYLKTGPYNFGFANKYPNKVEHFPYGNGLLVSYWDTSFGDNNKSEHPGEGLILPVDSHPKPLLRNDGTPWRARVQVYDAPFSTHRTDGLTLHVNSVANKIPSQKAQPVFDDARTYWYASAPTAGVKVPDAGVRITVLKQNKTTMTIQVSKSKG
ncbi:immune inhibitor A domain-containing protein [Kineosporia sp. R_H_3]|uniref:immune inhibitor A domain-containing protein n=1 Tax=Kineosporia sp. R_H_3 TaxID=1961848 RepID=UPI000B4B447C|nr:immune inhibitor A domain-containing protein [Kineosporia sp. R_H_3]